ncbi:carboxypeptidase-like regulatory domain-containing protein [Gemmatimonadota bacterium]
MLFRRIAALVLFLAAATVNVTLLQAQERGSILGTVVAEATLLPLQGAVVSIDGTEVRTVTDQEGRFDLSETPIGEITLRVEHGGHVTLTEVLDVTPGEVVLVSFRLTSIVVALEALVVQATRDSMPKDQGFADGSIDVSDDAAFLSAADLLEQTITGLSFTRGSGVVGGGVGMRIRGASSLSLSDAPAVYVDGVLVGDQAPGSRGSTQVLHVLQLIPADAVKRIRVLRGPAAATRYPEAKNGVILVETWR